MITKSAGVKFYWLAMLVLAACAACEGPVGPQGEPGPAGSSCTVSDNGDGTFTIQCGEGTVVTIQEGQNGTSCSVVDNGDGSKTISCTDGTSVTVNDGSPGLACWDSNGNGVADAEEDVNNDGAFDAADCQGGGAGGGYPRIPAEYADMNLIQLHNPNSPTYQAADHGACTACHGDRLSERTLDPGIPTAHQAMFAIPPFSSLSGSELCERCHTYAADGSRVAIDILNYSSAGSGAMIRKQVDVLSCVGCHGPGSVKQFYQSSN